jgi:hypothetical protein
VCSGLKLAVGQIWCDTESAFSKQEGGIPAQTSHLAYNKNRQPDIDNYQIDQERVLNA